MDINIIVCIGLFVFFAVVVYAMLQQKDGKIEILNHKSWKKETIEQHKNIQYPNYESIVPDKKTMTHIIGIDANQLKNLADALGNNNIKLYINMDIEPNQSNNNLASTNLAMIVEPMDVENTANGLIMPIRTY